MKRQLSAATDSELAAALDIQRSAISQWKKRGAVPAKARRRCELIARHQDENEQARRQFSALPATIRQISRALALRYVIQTTELGDEEAGALLARALFLDEIERAAYILLTETMAQAGLDAPTAYRRLCVSPDLETGLAGKLMPARAA